MKNYKRIIMLFLILLIYITLSGCQSNEKILNNKFDNIDTVILLIGNNETTLQPDIIKEIYNLLLQTKVSIGNYDQSTDPKFVLIFKYKDGTNDIIRTTENGQFFYRNLSDNKWIGGKNNNILPVINKYLLID